MQGSIFTVWEQSSAALSYDLIKYVVEKRKGPT